MYIIGGDGSMRGAQALFKLICERRLAVTVAGIPKTIDNDIGLIDRYLPAHAARSWVVVSGEARSLRCRPTMLCLETGDVPASLHPLPLLSPPL